MTTARWMRAAAWAAMIVVVVSVIAGWVAIGRLAAATSQGLDRVDASLATAVDLADSTAASAGELQRVVTVVGDGLGSTGQSLAATRKLSGNVRGLIDSLSFFGGVDNLVSSLEETEASLEQLEADLATARASLDDADPVFAATVRQLQAIPSQIAASQAEVQASRDEIEGQVTLWRLAMVAAGIPIVLLSFVTSRLIAERHPRT
jgi:hypothetical protein